MYLYKVIAQPSIATIFPSYLFWDMDLSRLNIERDKDIIIPRALYFTNSRSFNEDISKLETFYNPQQIVQQLQVTKELISNEVCALVSQRYDIASFSRFSTR